MPVLVVCFIMKTRFLATCRVLDLCLFKCLPSLIGSLYNSVHCKTDCHYFIILQPVIFEIQLNTSNLTICLYCRWASLRPGPGLQRSRLYRFYYEVPVWLQAVSLVCPPSFIQWFVWDCTTTLFSLWYYLCHRVFTKTIN